jgi:galactonate dehydratase
LRNAPFHEFQHSIFGANLRFVEGDMSCEIGRYAVPTGNGLGVRPSAEALQLLEP